MHEQDKQRFELEDALTLQAQIIEKFETRK